MTLIRESASPRTTKSPDAPAAQGAKVDVVAAVGAGEQGVAGEPRPGKQLPNRQGVDPVLGP
ncbi:hypothetical protein [Arthrobacter sp. efr-133-R2A-120]|uniref:hypothetical protein n=1 Tax=Arthrobacter sp. efr-133-R2A-120 TaxID=3040277 RepID=UPI0025506D25|nr:hypothetical protein [Arthrobacter sp. efr-133-R2A-120]